MGKYNFDKIIDRRCTFSSKWSKDGWTKNIFGGTLPEDRICLHVADMDFKCPPQVIEAMHKIANEGIYGYSSIPNEYYDAVISWYSRRMNFHFTKNDIFYSAGTHTAISKCIKEFTKINEGIIVLTPSYSYHWDIEPLNRVMVGVEMINNNGYYTINYEEFEKACSNPNNTLFILCHPHNPTGRVFKKEELIELGRICKKHNVLVVSDEVHSDLIRKNVKFTPSMNVMDNSNLIVCTAVNKTFNLAGLQMTNMIITDPKLKEPFINNHDSPTPFGIASVIAAYNESEDWVNELNEYLDNSIEEVISYINTNLPKIKVHKPEGTYILWLDFSEYNLPCEEIRRRIYDEAHVVMQGGTNYDEKSCEQFQRMCIANPKAQVLEALERIKKQFE
ncbi:MAG: aminotransferase class I/II-fold pyridoxal phosphate-dependent enzyme [Erysipelotrichaceae bacterium]|nr:aminotransferase class I/II-fold pyridoxal phosphate-dependent enzyme [Erysipelotrichaceae bacterium]